MEVVGDGDVVAEEWVEETMWSGRGTGESDAEGVGGAAGADVEGDGFSPASGRRLLAW